MKKQDNKTPISFKLIGISTKQFAILHDMFDKKNDQINMSLELKFEVDTDNRIIGVFFLVQFKQENNPFIVMEIVNQYQIEEQAWNNFKKTDEGLVIPKNLATHLVVLTVGTLRGALHSKIEGTEFNQFILPTIDVTQMVTDDVVLN